MAIDPHLNFSPWKCALSSPCGNVWMCTVVERPNFAADVTSHLSSREWCDGSQRRFARSPHEWCRGWNPISRYSTDILITTNQIRDIPFWGSGRWFHGSYSLVMFSHESSERFLYSRRKHVQTLRRRRKPQDSSWEAPQAELRQETVTY